MGRFFSTNQNPGPGALASALQGLSQGALTGYGMGRQRKLEDEQREREEQERPLREALMRANARTQGVIPATEAVRTDFGGTGAIGNIATAIEGAERYKPLGESGYVYDEFDNPIERERKETEAATAARLEQAAIGASTRAAIAEMNDMRRRWEVDYTQDQINARNRANISARRSEGEANRSAYGRRPGDRLTTGDGQALREALRAAERQIDDTRFDLRDARNAIPEPFQPVPMLGDSVNAEAKREHATRDSAARARADSIAGAYGQQGALRDSILSEMRGVPYSGSSAVDPFRDSPPVQRRGTDGAANSSMRMQDQRQASRSPMVGPPQVDAQALQAAYAEIAQAREEALAQGEDPVEVEAEVARAIERVSRQYGAVR
jgi:hypothetical protein